MSVIYAGKIAGSTDAGEFKGILDEIESCRCPELARLGSRLKRFKKFIPTESSVVGQSMESEFVYTSGGVDWVCNLMMKNGVKFHDHNFVLNPDDVSKINGLLKIALHILDDFPIEDETLLWECVKRILESPGIEISQESIYEVHRITEWAKRILDKNRNCKLLFSIA